MENTIERTASTILTARSSRANGSTVIGPQVEIGAEEARKVAKGMSSLVSKVIEANQLQEGQVSVGKNPKTYSMRSTLTTTSLLNAAKLPLAN